MRNVLTQERWWWWWCCLAIIRWREGQIKELKNFGEIQSSAGVNTINGHFWTLVNVQIIFDHQCSSSDHFCKCEHHQWPICDIDHFMIRSYFWEFFPISPYQWSVVSDHLWLYMFVVFATFLNIIYLLWILIECVPDSELTWSSSPEHPSCALFMSPNTYLSPLSTLCVPKLTWTNSVHPNTQLSPFYVS